MATRPKYPQPVQPSEMLLRSIAGRYPMWVVSELVMEKRTAVYVVATFHLKKRGKHTTSVEQLARTTQKDLEQLILDTLEKKENPPRKGIVNRANPTQPKDRLPFRKDNNDRIL